MSPMNARPASNAAPRTPPAKTAPASRPASPIGTFLRPPACAVGPDRIHVGPVRVGQDGQGLRQAEALTALLQPRVSFVRGKRLVDALVGPPDDLGVDLHEAVPQHLCDALALAARI